MAAGIGSAWKGWREGTHAGVVLDAFLYDWLDGEGSFV